MCSHGSCQSGVQPNCNWALRLFCVSTAFVSTRGLPVGALLLRRSRPCYDLFGFCHATIQQRKSCGHWFTMQFLCQSACRDGQPNNLAHVAPFRPGVSTVFGAARLLSLYLLSCAVVCLGARLCAKTTCGWRGRRRGSLLARGAWLLWLRSMRWRGCGGLWLRASLLCLRRQCQGWGVGVWPLFGNSSLPFVHWTWLRHRGAGQRPFGPFSMGACARAFLSERAIAFS